MSLFRWFKRRPSGGCSSEYVGDQPDHSKLAKLPTEPFVFECKLCGKVFEARRLHPTCTECDSPDVELISD